MKTIILSLFLSFTALCNAQYQPLGKGEIIDHEYFSLSYVERHEQAEWVYYKITRGTTERTNDFREDTDINTESASLGDYKGSGYDRGHLCPAADMKINKLAMSESFLLSNMSPQLPGFNRGVWKRLEAKVRGWGYRHDTYVATGPIFRDNRGFIGENEVTIPGAYYKVVYQPSTNLMIGFILSHQKSEASLVSFVVPVDYVESLTSIDFFPQLEDELEVRLESTRGNINAWNN